MPRVYLTKKHYPRVELVYLGKSGVALLFLEGGAGVERVLTAEQRSKFLSNRAEVASYLPVPAARVTSSGHIWEASCGETNLFMVGVECRLRVFEDLVRRYSERAAIAKTSENCIHQLMDQIAQLDGSCADRRRDAVSRFDGDWPAFMMHADLSGNNIFVEGSSYRVIDFDDAAERPFFFDLLLLALRDRELRSALGIQGIRDSLSAIAASGGYHAPIDLKVCATFVAFQLAVDATELTGERLEVTYRRAFDRLDLYALGCV